MNKRTTVGFKEQTAYNLRRAAEERAKAAAAPSERARRPHIEMAEIFEARARDLPTLH